MSEVVKRKIADALDLPQDIILNVPRVIITGKAAVFIEHHKGIIEYNSKCIKINSAVGVIIIMGKNLLIKTIIADEITIEGEITSIEIEE